LYGEWFEWGFLRVAAERNPTVGFLLIGDPPENRNMPPNVVFMGMRNNHELSNYLQACDATMIPFRPGEIVDAVSPVKVFEYLFLGKPVISTKMVEIINYPGVYQAEDQNEFARLCSLELISQASGNELDTFFSQNSWNSRVDQIVSWPQLSFKYSIITLIHNNEKIIRRHLDTLLFHLRDIPVEIIIVDNCSVDNGPGIVKEEYGDRVKLVCNPVNGCSSGRNLGATAACGDILVFFDSDQWFTSVAWLYEADFLICKHPEVGAFGWGSGWFADKNLGGPIVDYIDKRGIFSDEYKSVGFRTDIHYLATCGFFVTRALFERVGGFDPIFDPTIFEDTDLSLKIVDYGLKVAYRNFCGIMHQPHQTTKAAEQSAIYQELWNRNKDHMWHKWEAMLNDKLGKGHHEIH
jgi:glycosyltransferase involved in cell wall biosynthesis